MKAQITEKINTKTIQFAWEDSQVLYLQIKEYRSGKRVYSIKDMPEGSALEVNTATPTSSTIVIGQGTLALPTNDTFSIPVPFGVLDVNYPSNTIAEKIPSNRNLINSNIQYLRNVQEIFDYIEEIEKNENTKAKELD